MKKAAITTAIVTALVSGSTLAATIYSKDGTELNIGGRAEARFNISDDNESSTHSSFADSSRARLNITGKTQIEENLYGFGKYEAEFDGESELTNRYFFAGVGTELGEFSHGRQDSAQVMLTDITDVFATFGGDAADIVAGNKDKLENNFVYSGKFMDALTVKANYVAAEKKDANSYGIAAMYDFGMFNLGAGYVYQDGDMDSDNQFNIAGQFKLDAMTFGALFTMGSLSSQTDTDENGDYTGFELTAEFKATEELTLVAGYNYQKLDADTGSDVDVANNIAVEAVYKFNSHLRTYTGYKLENADNKDNQLQAGLRYDF